MEEVTDEPHDTNVDVDGSYLTLAEVLGRPGRSYAQWARDHTSDFAVRRRTIWR